MFLLIPTFLLYRRPAAPIDRVQGALKTGLESSRSLEVVLRSLPVDGVANGLSTSRCKGNSRGVAAQLAARIELHVSIHFLSQVLPSVEPVQIP